MTNVPTNCDDSPKYSGPLADYDAAPGVAAGAAGGGVMRRAGAQFAGDSTAGGVARRQGCQPASRAHPGLVLPARCSLLTPRRSACGGQDMEAAVSDAGAAGANTRPLRVAVMAASALALVAVAAVLVSAGVSSGSRADELMYGGPLSFDMVHTHILNMKMRRSRLKEKLKEAALKRKDRELAQEHGFGQGAMVRPQRMRAGACAPRAACSRARPRRGAAVRPLLCALRCATDGLRPGEQAGNSAAPAAAPAAPQQQMMAQQPPQMMQQPPMQQQMYQQPPQMMQQPPMQQQMYQQPPPMMGQQPPQQVYGEPYAEYPVPLPPRVIDSARRVSYRSSHT